MTALPAPSAPAPPAPVPAPKPRAPPCAPGDEFELHFIGELECGWDFPGLEVDDGLFVDYSCEAGMDWLPIARKEGFVGQTQTCYADAHGVYVFNHPIDFHYIADSVASWPQLHLQVFKLDAAGRVETLAYGSMTLPNACGHREVTVRTWRPLQRNVLEEARTVSSTSGADGALPASRAEVLHGEVRSKMVTKTSGSILVALDTIFRNAGKHQILTG
ncbi:B9 domain-containing protein 2 [Durusdinium trenchii]|uniref:B9 domain-containing protein 2 n=1 Tax=Durusdinium trenchii TaxID=1381693 RepID=A0ABP0S6S6_9DINO